MIDKWNYLLDPGDPMCPTIWVVIHSWDPFQYVVSLTAVMDGQGVYIRRWDNIDKPDHVDIFYLSGNVRKHQRPPIGPILDIGGIVELGDHIAKKYRYYIRVGIDG